MFILGLSCLSYTCFPNATSDMEEGKIMSIREVVWTGTIPATSVIASG
jgi:hypothetical protein